MLSIESTKEIFTDKVGVSFKLPTISDILPKQLLPYWEKVQSIPYVESIVMLLLFALVALFVRTYLLRLISKLVSHTESNLDDIILNILKTPIFYTIVLIGVISVCSVSPQFKVHIDIVSAISLTIIVLYWLIAALKLSNAVFKGLARSRFFTKVSEQTEPLFSIVSKIIAITLGSYIIMLIWGLNPVGLLASAGVAGVAIGFAAKDSLANLFSGFFILADRPYKLGDFINLEQGDRGRVSHIGLRSTRLVTTDDIEITIPNGIIGNSKISNESGGPQTKIRVRVSLQCSYEDDLDKVEEVLLQVANDLDDVSKYPAPRVRVRGFGDSGIDIQLLCWIDRPQDRGRILHLLYRNVHQGFTKNNLNIPYPQREINIIKQTLNNSSST